MLHPIYEPKPRTLWQKITSCVTLRNLRFLYMLPFFTKKTRRCTVCGSKPDRVEHFGLYTALDHCGECGHVYNRKMPKQRILNVMYGKFDYWIRDKEHQEIRAIEPGPHWEGYLGARIGIARRTGVLNGTPKRFLEIGCSEGILLHELQRTGHQALGCEMNAPLAQAGMKALGVEIRSEPFEKLAVEPASFDGVLSFHSVEHMTDLQTVFGKIARILKPGGSVLIEVPIGPEEYPNYEHVQFFTKTSLKRLLEIYFEEGEILENRYMNPFGIEVASLYGIGRRPRRGSNGAA